MTNPVSSIGPCIKIQSSQAPPMLAAINCAIVVVAVVVAAVDGRGGEGRGVRLRY